VTLPPGDGVIHSLGNLLANLLGDFTANWLRCSCPDHGRGISLKRNFNEGENKGRDEKSLHDREDGTSQ